MRSPVNHSNFRSVSVIGLGYIGLPTAAILASNKIRVFGVDTNPAVVDTINQGKMHITEPDLDSLVKSSVVSGYLSANTVPEPADAFIIAVPTPLKEDNKPDLTYVLSAASAIASVLKQGDLVIIESTCPIGTTELVCSELKKLRSDLVMPGEAENLDINIAYCPERVLPGRVLLELSQNPRVIGGMTPACAQKASALYQIFVSAECTLTNSRTAELCKLAENSYRDVNIAFANELSMICAEHQINVSDLIKLTNRHPRVSILSPGPGVGGHCIAVDPWFIVSSSPDTAKLIHMARIVNDMKTDWVVGQILNQISAHLKQNPGREEKDMVIACLGVTFKPDIDDVRESPAVKIIEAILRSFSGYILVVDPNVNLLPKKIESACEHCHLDKALQETDLMIKLVNHQCFKDSEHLLMEHANYCDYTTG